jgi:integrase
MADRRLKKRGTKNGKDLWTARVPLPRAADGSRRQHRFTFIGNKKDAEKTLVAELSALNNGTYVETDRTTLGQYVTDFLANQKATYAHTSWQRFESLARINIIPKLGDVPLQKMTSIHLKKAYAEWRKAGLSAQTVVHHHRFIHRVLAEALEEGLVRQNVATMKKKNKPHAPKREMRTLSAEEIGRLVAAAAGTAFLALVTVAIACGARRGELLGAKWDDLDVKRGTLSIRRSLEQTKAGVAEKTPKSGKSRIVHLPETSLETLRRHRVAQGRISPGYIFLGDPAGNPWTPQKVSDGFRALAKKAKIVGASFHTLRHTCASMLLAQGVHPKVVQEMLGHSTIAITMDLYSHSTPSLQAEAATKLDAALQIAMAPASKVVA